MASQETDGCLSRPCCPLWLRLGSEGLLEDREYFATLNPQYLSGIREGYGLKILGSRILSPSFFEPGQGPPRCNLETL